MSPKTLNFDYNYDFVLIFLTICMYLCINYNDKIEQISITKYIIYTHFTERRCKLRYKYF